MNDDVIRTPDTPELDDFEVEDTEGENAYIGGDAELSEDEGPGDDPLPFGCGASVNR